MSGFISSTDVVVSPPPPLEPPVIMIPDKIINETGLEFTMKNVSSSIQFLHGHSFIKMKYYN